MNVLVSRQIVRRWCIATAISLPALLLMPMLSSGVGVAYAQGQEKEQPKRETRRTQALSSKAYEKFSKASEAIEEKNYNEAIKILDEMTKGTAKPNDFELANALNLYAFVYYNQEDYAKAINAYKRILTLPEAPEGMLVQTRYSLAQLYFVTEDYQRGVDTLQEWFKLTTQPSASAYFMLAQGQFQLNKPNDALTSINKAIALYRESGKVPEENWLNLQRYLYQEKNDNKKVVSILEEMLQHYPKKAYWLNLSQVYGELKQDSKQLAALETAYRQNMLDKEGEITNLSYMFLLNDVPYKAGKALEKGIKDQYVKANAKNLELEGNSWRQARETDKAIPVMVSAAKASSEGEIWAQLGNLYLDADDFDKAVDAIQQGLKKGGVKRPDTANLVLGMAYYNQKKYDSARKAFNVAKKDKRSKKYAEQWINYMDTELERQRSLTEG